MNSTTKHIPVLCVEVLEALRAHQGGVFLDCTFGGGGHSNALLGAHASNQVIACDRDRRAVERGNIRFAGEARLELHHAPFSRVGEICRGRKLRGVLADLGMSTDQLFEGRGFSFQDTSIADMRMDESCGVSAHELLRALSVQDLFVLLREGGVGQDARRIAQAIVRARPVASAKELAELVSRVSRATRGKGEGAHPATVVFQALRIAVNREWDELRALLAVMPTLVADGGRCAVIAFHSLEDKLLTRTMRAWESGPEFSAVMPTPAPAGARRLGTLLTKKALAPTEEELARNPSSRSARMRVFEFSGESYGRMS